MLLIVCEVLLVVLMETRSTMGTRMVLQARFCKKNKVSTFSSEFRETDKMNQDQIATKSWGFKA